VNELSLNLILLAFLPLTGALVGLTWFYFKKRNSKAEPPIFAEDEKRRDTLSTQRKVLRKAVGKVEKEETRALQIYAVIKSLAEAHSWEDMSHRLVKGIQKIFDVSEFQLFSLEDDKEWTLIQKRGDWRNTTPLKKENPSDVEILPPSETQEPLPVLIIPITTSFKDDHPVNGVLQVKKRTKGHQQERALKDIGQEFSDNMSMAFNKAFFIKKMEARSQYDGLTGLLSRRPFMERLAQEFKYGSVYNSPFSLLLVDIDHFKTVNDTFGHNTGDLVLARVAELLSKSTYETDIVGRYGGEEFLILLPKSKRDGVVDKANYIRQRISQEPFYYEEQRFSVTVSIGIAHYPQDGENSNDLLNEADRALYKAKSTGRNRVVSL